MRPVSGSFSLLLVSTILYAPLALPTQAQITHAEDGTNSIVNQTGNTFNITNGTQVGSNLFHSFQQFGLSQGQVANFVSNPSIQNILGRVTGGSTSIVNGLIQVTGSNANLYLMNPAGIVFGVNASLNVPGSFTATTANAIGLGNGWFNAIGDNNYMALSGQPNNQFAFTALQPGVIINAANLAINRGQNITLLGGTIVNMGSLTAPEGTVMISAVPGEKLVRISQVGGLLNLEFQPLPAGIPVTTAASTLPQLLTGGNLGNATGLMVENGVAKLTGSSVSVEPGDVVAKNMAAQAMLLSADKNITLVESQLRASGDLTLLANRQIKVRDSVHNPVLIQSGRDLRIQGNQGIDILALNHPNPAFQSVGTLSLISDGVISGDTHYTSGNFSIRKLDGTPGTFVSLYDPIISANGDVTFGDYSGSSLKVEATGNITTGNIRITSADTRFEEAAKDTDTDIDRWYLGNHLALILQAGVSELKETRDIANSSPNPPFSVPLERTTFIAVPTVSGGWVTIGGSASSSIPSIQADYVDITAPNGIRISGPVKASSVKLAAVSGDVVVHSVQAVAKFITKTNVDNQQKEINLDAVVDITAGGLFQAIGTVIGIDETPLSILAEGSAQRRNEGQGFDFLQGSVIIRYAGGVKDLLGNKDKSIQIFGDGYQPFIIGPDSSSSFVPLILPEGVSGTSGMIEIGVYRSPLGQDGNLVSPIRNPNRPFLRNLPAPELLDPIEDILQPAPQLNPIGDSSLGLSNLSFNAESIERQFNSQIQGVACYSANLASNNLVSDPCVQAIQDEQQILKILDQPADSEKSKALME